MIEVKIVTTLYNYLFITAGMSLHQSCQGGFLHHRLPMSGEVTSKIISLHKTFSAVAAHVVLAVGVLHPHVLLHVRVLGEGHPAPCAHVRLVAAVEQLVADKVVLELELLSANITFKVPLGLMC